MDELSKQAESVGGWENLARALDAELNKRKETLKKKNPGRTKKIYNEQDLIDDPSFPWPGGGTFIAQYVEERRAILREVYGWLSDGTYSNKISNIRMRYPAKANTAGKTQEQTYTDLRALAACRT